ATLREQTEILEMLNRQAQEAVRVRDDFLAAASHDLKNPLAAIQGTAQVLQRTLSRTGTIPPERLNVGLESIEAAIAQMTDQINELLDVARLRLGQPLSLDRQPADLVALVRRAIASYQSATERHMLRLMVEGASPDGAAQGEIAAYSARSAGASATNGMAPGGGNQECPSIIGNWDAPRIERVVDNLLSNALKYSPDGGEILVRVTREEGCAILSVRDQGVGIPAPDLPRIFDRFTRARNVIGRFGGSGIGLAASHQVVTQHGGQILVESEEGNGSIFTIRLPLGT
ncbi:MAG TPA: HAMP domain-containing sensor histidine kinase, partial [Chloroflexota bacterium]|nr:HAMP domain-containing sensor histidine kinase [Chloroflexota bacterium]